MSRDKFNTDAVEVSLFAENTSNWYFTYAVPNIKRMAKLCKVWGMQVNQPPMWDCVVDSAVRAYEREFLVRGDRLMIDRETRQQIAEYFRDTYAESVRDEMEGNF